MSNNQMNIRYTYRIQDFADINEAVDAAVPSARRIRLLSLISGALLLLAPYLAGSSIFHPDQFLLGMSPMSLCLGLWGLQTPKKSAEKFYASAINGTEYRTLVTDEGITTISPTVRTELNWAAFSRIIQGKETLALVYETVMYLFPKRAFESDQWDGFLMQVRDRIPTSDAQPSANP